jgi:hypothetical protein
MKALTVCQPFAELICRGEKRVENRRHHYFKDYRGPLLIHAGLSREWLDLDESGARDEAYDIPLGRMSFGAIVGRAIMADFFAVTYRMHSPVVPKWIASKRPWLTSHNHVEGPYCLVLSDVNRLERPIPCRGQQGLFEIDLEVEAMEAGYPAIWLPAGPPARSCRVCGCTEHSPCDDDETGGCEWVEADLCNACVGKEVSRQGAKARRRKR